MATRAELGLKLLEVLDHLGEMPPESGSPKGHFRVGVNAILGMRRYLLHRFDPGTYREKVRDRHFHVLDNMIFSNLVQAFERFIKDMASVCIDHLCDRVFDNRFDDLTIRGGSFTAHYSDSSVGKALSESDTWLSCQLVNDRFKKFLRDPTNPGDSFQLFPNRTREETEAYRIMSLVFQLRHTIVHNVGALTRSDAAKLQVLA